MLPHFVALSSFAIKSLLPPLTHPPLNREQVHLNGLFFAPPGAFAAVGGYDGECSFPLIEP
jgi:hypothetical protein